MNSEDDNISRVSLTGKGKGRARPQDLDENTPLLTSGSQIIDDDVELTPRPRRLASKLLSIFLCSLSLSVLLLALVLLIAYSYGSRASGLSPEELQHALEFRGPDRLDVLNVTTGGGIWLRVKGRVGVDAGKVIGVNSDQDDSLFRDLWKSFGRWGIRRLDRVTVNLSTVHVSSKHDPLANITLPPLVLSLAADPPPTDTWLEDFTATVYIEPTTNASALIRFVRESWRDGSMRVETITDNAVVWGGGLNEGGWRAKLRSKRTNIRLRMGIKVPHLPGFPPPGRNNPLPSPSRLVSLQSFVIESHQDQLRIRANATAVNPIPPTFHYTSSKLPFTVSLPAVNNTFELIPVASVYTEPFSLTHPNISLSITGHVLPLEANTSSTVSALLANYVSLRDSEISISSPLFPYATVDAIFPAVRPRPQILRDVTIKDMKILPSGNSMLASGTVFARVVLPKGVNAGINVTKVLPDVLIFDGPVPGDPETDSLRQNDDDRDTDIPPAPPLPDPLPPRAFAHIRPEDWLVSNCTAVVSDEDEGTSVEVTAKIVDVPLEVLPGRDREFRNFVGKVIFGSHGALAGVQGVAAVTVQIQGLPFKHGRADELELDGLPFQGSVWIGKKNTF